MRELWSTKRGSRSLRLHQCNFEFLKAANFAQHWQDALRRFRLRPCSCAPKKAGPLDTLLQIGAQSINGLSNRKGGARGHAADPGFVRLLAALQRLQASGVIDLRVEVSKESKQ